MAQHLQQYSVPINAKYLLSYEEAVAYTGIGIGKIREIAKNNASQLTLQIGKKRLLKRSALEHYLDTATEL